MGVGGCLAARRGQDEPGRSTALRKGRGNKKKKGKRKKEREGKEGNCWSARVSPRSGGRDVVSAPRGGGKLPGISGLRASPSSQKRVCVRPAAVPYTQLRAVVGG